MKITKQRLKEIIKEEAYKVLSKRQDQAQKDAKSRSLERKRNWIPGLSLGRGIVEGDDGEEMELFTEEFKTVMQELEEDRVLNPTVFKKRCMKLGLRSLEDFMKIQNLLRRSADGELVPKPATKEGLDEENPCGQRFHKSSDGKFYSGKGEPGIASQFFCKPEKGRGKITGANKSERFIPNAGSCGRSAREESPSKDRPCDPANEKNKKKKKKS
ncbi:MAG TPA: hypothetical protein DHN29_12270 [Cytophagales bacterium]|nr:hypothetical protein [Cytophagales bacterium]